MTTAKLFSQEPTLEEDSTSRCALGGIEERLYGSGFGESDWFAGCELDAAAANPAPVMGVIASNNAAKKREVFRVFMTFRSFHCH